MGRLLKRLGQSRQVLAVTHLPQVAAHGDQHFVVLKESGDGGRPLSILRQQLRDAAGGVEGFGPAQPYGVSSAVSFSVSSGWPERYAFFSAPLIPPLTGASTSFSRSTLPSSAAMAAAA